MCPHLPGQCREAHTTCPNTSACPNPMAHVTHTRLPCPVMVGLTTALFCAPTPRETKERGEGVLGSPPHIPASSHDPSSPGHATRPPPSIFPFGWPPCSFTYITTSPETQKRGEGDIKPPSPPCRDPMVTCPHCACANIAMHPHICTCTCTRRHTPLCWTACSQRHC